MEIGLCREIWWQICTGSLGLYWLCKVYFPTSVIAHASKSIGRYSGGPRVCVLVNVQAGGVCQFFEGWMTSRRQSPRGGGVLVNVLKAEGDDVTRAMSKGGGCL